LNKPFHGIKLKILTVANKLPPIEVLCFLPNPPQPHISTKKKRKKRKHSRNVRKGNGVQTDEKIVEVPEGIPNFLRSAHGIPFRTLFWLPFFKFHNLKTPHPRYILTGIVWKQISIFMYTKS